MPYTLSFYSIIALRWNSDTHSHKIMNVISLKRKVKTNAGMVKLNKTSAVVEVSLSYMGTNYLFHFFNIQAAYNLLITLGSNLYRICC